MRLRSLTTAVLSLSLLGTLAACSSAEDRQAEDYAAVLAEVGDTMMQQGTSVQTLFAIQAQPLQWNEEQRDMWNGIEEAISDAASSLEDATPPAELEVPNTQLVAAIKALAGGMHDLTTILENPSAATPEQLAGIMQRVSDAEQAIDEPLKTIEAYYDENYGDDE